MALCAAPRVTSHHPYDGGVVPTAADNNIDDAVVDDVGVGDTKLGESCPNTSSSPYYHIALLACESCMGYIGY